MSLSSTLSVCLFLSLRLRLLSFHLTFCRPDSLPQESAGIPIMMGEEGGGRGEVVGGIALLDVPSGFSPQILWDSVEQFVEQVLGYSHAGFIPRIATRWIHPSLI